MSLRELIMSRRLYKKARGGRVGVQIMIFAINAARALMEAHKVHVYHLNLHANNMYRSQLTGWGYPLKDVQIFTDAHEKVYTRMK